MQEWVSQQSNEHPAAALPHGRRAVSVCVCVCVCVFVCGCEEKKCKGAFTNSQSSWEWIMINTLTFAVSTWRVSAAPEVVSAQRAASKLKRLAATARQRSHTLCVCVCLRVCARVHKAAGNTVLPTYWAAHQRLLTLEEMKGAQIR